MLVDNQQLISFHVFTRSWASVCVSYFFVPVETGAPPFEETISLYKGVVSGCQCETLIRPVSEARSPVGRGLCCIIRVALEVRGPMELKTQALDRVLEAISPSLGAELDRIIEDVHRKLEMEFQERLQATVRETETAAEAASQAQREQSLAVAREEIQKEISERLDHEFKRALDETAVRLRSEAAAEHTRLQEQIDHWRVLAEAQQQLAHASSQAEILARLLRLAEPFAAGLAIYVMKAESGFALWKSRGKTIFPETVLEDAKDPDLYFKVIAVRGKKVAAVCAAQPYKVETLEFLVSSLEAALEVFGLKLRASMAKPSPAAELADNDASGVGTAQPPVNS